MRIELTKEQYIKLIELVYAGQWLINAWRNANEVLEEYEEAEQHLYSFYKRFEAEDCIEYYEEEDRYYPTQEFEDKILDFADEYNDDNFWDKLAEYMAYKDIIKSKGTSNLENRLKYEEKYYKEFAENGIDRLYIDWQKDPNNKYKV